MVTTKINNTTWKISLARKKEDNEDFYDENGVLCLFGQTNFVTQEIFISNEVTDERKMLTIIHELTHAFHDVYLASQHIKEKFDEEDICCFMASYSQEILDLAKVIYFQLKNEEYLEIDIDNE